MAGERLSDQDIRELMMPDSYQPRRHRDRPMPLRPPRLKTRPNTRSRPRRAGRGPPTTRVKGHRKYQTNRLARRRCCRRGDHPTTGPADPGWTLMASSWYTPARDSPTPTTRATTLDGGARRLRPHGFATATVTVECDADRPTPWRRSLTAGQVAVPPRR